MEGHSSAKDAHYSDSVVWSEMGTCMFFFIYRNMVCMLCFNFLLGLEFTFLCMVMIYDNDFETNKSKILTKVISETHHACVDCTVPYVHI